MRVHLQYNAGYFALCIHVCVCVCGGLVTLGLAGPPSGFFLFFLVLASMLYTCFSCVRMCSVCGLKNCIMYKLLISSATQHTCAVLLSFIHTSAESVKHASSQLSAVR